jgi:RNA-directed DNA polymerase
MQRWRRRCAQGNVIVVRYADDMVVGFQYLADAHRFLAELKQRLEAFALELHPDKTRIIEFAPLANSLALRPCPGGSLCGLCKR